jgi:hypothetical protein
MGFPTRALTLAILSVTRAPLHLLPAYPRIVASRTRRAYVLSDCKSPRWRVTVRDGMAIIVGGKTQTYAAQDLWFEQAPHHPPGASFPTTGHVNRKLPHPPGRVMETGECDEVIAMARVELQVRPPFTEIWTGGASWTGRDALYGSPLVGREQPVVFPPLPTVAKGVSHALAQFPGLATTRPPRRVSIWVSRSTPRLTLWRGVCPVCAGPPRR